MPSLPPYVVLYKEVGDTPLRCIERWRATKSELTGIPIAYAGRLDPLASGLLLVLVGEECKRQDVYHALDKTYEVSILFGINSDSGDVLGLVEEVGNRIVDQTDLQSILTSLTGEITLPYPIFSARTVQGKPLHTWAMEGRLAEIVIPSQTSTIYQLELKNTTELSRQAVVESALEKINSIPPVTDLRKALGNDFRRSAVRPAWHKVAQAGLPDDVFLIAEIVCTCSSGTYMRSLASHIAKHLGTAGLAFSINRTAIGHFDLSQNKWPTSFILTE